MCWIQTWKKAQTRRHCLRKFWQIAEILCLYGYICFIYAIKNQKIVVLSQIWYNICKYWCPKQPKTSQLGIPYQKRRLNVEIFNSQFCGNLRYWKRCLRKDFNFFHVCPFHLSFFLVTYMQHCLKTRNVYLMYI